MDLEENITTLLSMGFENVDNIKKALRLSKNDINEAVAILTNEHSEYDLCNDVEMKVEIKDAPSSQALMSSIAPPPYESTSETEEFKVYVAQTAGISDNSMEFPTTNLYELESRVFTDRWSIPYKKEESLGKCLIYANRLAEEGLCEAHDSCKQFIERCMPEAFKKLLNSSAVRTWGLEVQDGVRGMLYLFMNLAVARLKYEPISEAVCQVLEKAFDPESEFNMKNKHKLSTYTHWMEISGTGEAFGINENTSEPYGWLLDLINKFGHLGGFLEVQNRFSSESIKAKDMASLLVPLSKCAEFLNPSKVCQYLLPCMETSVRHIEFLTDSDIKSKNICFVSDLLRAMRVLCFYLWPQQVEATSSLCLKVILRMLRCPHFSARMNGLKEVMKLIDDCTSFKLLKVAIDAERLLCWLTENKVLSIALEGNIDQVQYSDKIKGIIEFIGPRLSLEELSKIWNIQDGQNAHIVDNIHAIMSAASSKFNSEQFHHLLSLIQSTWQNGNDQMRKRLLSFIGYVGRETMQGKTSTKVLDLLWDLAHSPDLPASLVELALEELFTTLGEVSHKYQTKKEYSMRCIEEIRKGLSILPSLKLLHSICKNILKSGIYKQDRAGLHELNKVYDVFKLITCSLAKCHKQAVALVGDGQLNPSLLIDGRYSHKEHLVEHLSFLRFLLQEGAQYLQWNRAKEIWDTLISNPEACEHDREVCFEWFSSCLQDLEPDTQFTLFQQKLLKLDPLLLTSRGFNCFKTYFESVNTSEHKLRRTEYGLVTEKLDLTGTDFFWQVSLAADESIAAMAIEYLLEISYHALSPKLKKDPLMLHKKFITECYKRLEAVAGALGGTAIYAAVSNATKTLTAISVSEVACYNAPTRTAKFQSICRLLQIAEQYVSSIEETHNAPRTILPHGTSFLGHRIFLQVHIDYTEEEFIIVCHSNETLDSVIERISKHINRNSSEIQLFADEISLSKCSRRRLIRHFNFLNKQILTVKIVGSSGLPTVASQEVTATTGFVVGRDSSFTIETANSSCHTYLLEQEKQLPGVVMAAGGQVFDMLYHIASLGDKRIITHIRKLLHLIPTDPTILDGLDSISAKKIIEIPSPSDTSKCSPHSSPKKFTVSSPIREKCDDPKEILKKLFCVSAEVSPFRLLYNLEVLIGKLMPVMQDAGTVQSAHMFSDDFHAAGGLQLILNILQKDSLSNDVDYDIRFGCYMTALTVARYLLCGQTGLEITRPLNFTQPVFCTPDTAVIKFPLHSFPCKHNLVGLTLPNTKCNKTIYDMKPAELAGTVISLVRLTWASAAGILCLVNCSLPTKEGNHLYIGRRSRQNSTGSSTSTGSESSELGFYAGICSQQEFVSNNDSLLAQKALEFLVTCITFKPDMFGTFSSLSCVNDFIIDVLLGSLCSEVRQCALHQFHKLSYIKTTTLKAHHFLLLVLLKTHLPLWVPSSSIRGSSLRLLCQCAEYFELVCQLLNCLTDDEQKSLNFNIKQMLEDEVSWLQGFSPSSSILLHSADSALIAGHCKLIKTLLTRDVFLKKEFGEILIPDLLTNFLFPASPLISAGTACPATGITQSFTPKCITQESRVSAYDVLIELASGCDKNLEKIVQHLMAMHHYVKPELVKEYEYEPLVACRAVCGYVGLKNAGATCYMNSVIQQLYMQPGVKESVLSIDENIPDEESLFFQVQMVFGHLLESKLQYHTPENFWRCCRLWGEPINVREQQDAFDFFIQLIDQVDEYLQKNGLDPIFKPNYEGSFSDQKICQGCPHRYEREEMFMALNLPVKSHSLLDSLDQFVKGELLEGQNSYFCEKCEEKRNAVKRTCFKNLPPVLVMQLKRFDYDWESNRSLKFDDYFKFPWFLDMSPYTAEGIQEKESLNQENCEKNKVHGSMTALQNVGNTIYELVGVIVHSGQANAGHYYSYIKERRLNCGTNLGKWLKFNDTTVEEFDMNDVTLEAECFGGTYKAKVRDSSSPYPETRQRYWNAYMLFYEKWEGASKVPRTPRKTPSKFSFRKSEKEFFPGSNNSPPKSSYSFPIGVNKHKDSLSQLTQLVDRGEKQGLFLEKMPARIQQVVREENLRFMHNHDIYNDLYFLFVQHLAKSNLYEFEHIDYVRCAVNSVLPLSMNFLLNTYLRYKKKNSSIMNEWVDIIETTIGNCKEGSFWLIDFLSSDIGFTFLKPFLLECPSREVRQIFARIIEKAFFYFLSYTDQVPSSNLDHIIVYLLEMLNQDVPDNCRSCTQYFWLFSMYTQMGKRSCVHLIEKNAFHKFLIFLLGPAAANMQSTETYPRRWSPVQTQDFGSLHTAMATLILSCDFIPLRTCDRGKYPELKQYWSSDDTVFAMPDEISAALYGPGAARYLQEVVCACREVSGQISAFTDMLVQCCFCNKRFSSSIIHQIMLQYSSVPSNELKNLSQLLMEIIVMEDPLQFARVQLVIDGTSNDNDCSFDGMLAIIRANQINDSRRSYQGIKFLVGLSLKCSLVKDYLMQAPNKWQWAVNWLKKMMSEHTSWSSQGNVSISNEDSNTKTFQRTVSAQDTLAEATALLIELESPDSQDMVVDLDEDEKMDGLQMKIPGVEPISSDEARKLKRVQGMDDLDTIDT